MYVLSVAISPSHYSLQRHVQQPKQASIVSSDNDIESTFLLHEGMLAFYYNAMPIV